MIPAALVCMMVSACADQEPLGPEISQRIARNQSVSFDRFFVAWSENYSSSPIQMQLFTLDPRQERQFADFADERTLAFARAYPGRLYINGDEPDQYCAPPSEYAVVYHDFVAGIKAVDPTARFSPAGFAEPNYKCCPLPDDVYAPCWSEKHSIGYAQQFYDSYKQRYGVAPPVDEWRFHDFGLAYGPGDVDGWWWRVGQAAHWSVTHGANMVLASWGFMGWRIPESEYREYMKRAIGLLMSDSRINGAVYWSYMQWLGNPHYLVHGDESLTGVGQTYVNPLTDIPVDVAAVEAENGQAKLQWTNTTAAWSAEVEFWVQPPGASSFVYSKTERVASPGAAQTAFLSFTGGYTVKGRVRYYNPYGQADWSSFSNAVVMKASEVSTNKKKTTSRNGSLFCFLSKRIQGQSCT